MKRDCHDCDHLDYFGVRERANSREVCKARKMVVNTCDGCPQYTNETVRKFNALVSELDDKFCDIADTVKPEDAVTLNRIIIDLKDLGDEI